MKKLLTLLTLLALAGPLAAQTTAPTLIPFQGRLTDQNGVAYTNNQYTIVFQLYDQAVGGTLLWSERHEKVGVLNGMVNVFLGSIASLTNVSFSSTRYLGITVDGDNNPNTPDPEMVPRQMIIPAFWAKQADNATKLAGYDWTPLFGVNNPNGSISGAKLVSGSVPGTALANGSVTASHLAPNSVTGASLLDGSVTIGKLSMPQTGSVVGVGGIAYSPICDTWGTTSYNSLVNVTNTSGQQTSVTVTTTGRTVEISLISNGNNLATQGSTLLAQNDNGVAEAGMEIAILRDGQLISSQYFAGNRAMRFNIPPSAIRHLDQAPAGQHIYVLQACGSGSVGSYCRVYNLQLVAREL